MKKRNIIILLICVIVVLFISTIFYYSNATKYPFKKNIETTSITVVSGEGLWSIINDLEEKGLLKSKLMMKIKVKLNDINPKILPGNYDISKETSLNDFIDMLENEDLSKNQVTITIPEGYTIEKIGKVCEEKGLFTAKEFYDAVKVYELPDYIVNNPNKTYNLEGYLYPETYFFTLDSKPEEVIKTMLDKFLEEFKQAESDTGVLVDKKDIEKIIIKASLVEKEVRIDEERPKVASVIENRISKNMKLEFCSTVNYVIGYEGNTILSYSDIQVESPYNTYKYSGLPIGPIASPGIESIKAVLVPDKTSYLYFLTKDGVSTSFSKTEKEHEEAKKEMNIK